MKSPQDLHRIRIVVILVFSILFAVPGLKGPHQNSADQFKAIRVARRVEAILEPANPEII